jgi:hypothetical protein
MADSRAESWLSTASMTAWAAASGESKRSCAIEGVVQTIAIAAQIVQNLPVIMLSPPPATVPATTLHPTAAAAHPSTTAKSADASRSHASETAIALHARHPTVLITAEDTVVAR